MSQSTGMGLAGLVGYPLQLRRKPLGLFWICRNFTLCMAICFHQQIQWQLSLEILYLDPTDVPSQYAEKNFLGEGRYLVPFSKVDLEATDFLQAAW